jgi:hypothetical protein
MISGTGLGRSEKYQVAAATNRPLRKNMPFACHAVDDGLSRYIGRADDER